VSGVEEGEGDAECPVVRRKTRRVFDVVMSDQKLREFGAGCLRPFRDCVNVSVISLLEEYRK